MKTGFITMKNMSTHVGAVCAAALLVGLTSCRKDLCYDHTAHAGSAKAQVQSSWECEWERDYGRSWQDNWPDEYRQDYEELYPGAATGIAAFVYHEDGSSTEQHLPAEGGEPRRLTFTGDAGDEMGHRMGPNNIVMGWTADGSRIVFRSRSESFNSFCGQLYTVSAEGGMPEPLPLRNGGFCSYSPDGKRLAYNYVFREFRTWKRYEGGMADDIRIFDFDTKRSEQITSTKRQETFPMWTADGGRIFYLSDRDNDVMNLYMYDLAAKEHRMVTSCADYDIKFPTIWRNTIAYERGGYIYLFDTQTLEERKVEVEIDNDNSYSRTELRDVRDDVTDVAASPRGERLLVCAHGDIFSVPVKEGVTYNMTDTSGAREMNATYSPDGRRMAFVSDRSGEFLIYVQDVAGGRAEPVVEDIATYIFDYRWSPDSKLIVWTDKRNTLNITDVAARRTTEVERSGVSTFGCGAFSPDSRYLVYVRPEQQMNNIVVYDIASGEKHVVTDGWYNCSNPVFSEDGKYLLFSSSRTFNPIYSSTEWNHAYGSMDKLYILPLAEGAVRPFEPVNDAVAAVGTEDAAAQTDAKKTQERTEAAPETESVVYDFDGTEARIVELPVSTAGRYYNIRMFGNKVYYNRGGNTQMYDLDKREETDLGVGVDFIAGGDKVLVRAGGTYAVMDRPQGRVSAPDKGADFGGLKKRIDYREEWRQVYDELWRRMRDFFYDPDMHGVDWKAVHDKYAVLVPHVGHRTDLTYIVGEMIGELNVGHAYSNDASLHMRPHAERIKVGMLGAKFSKDRSGYFRVDSITRGANWNGATRSPLTLPEVDVRAGDYIVAVDGRPLEQSELSETTAVPGFEALGETAPQECVWQVEGLLEQPEVTAQSEAGDCRVEWKTPLNAVVTVEPDTEDAVALQDFFDRTARVYARYVSADASFAELKGSLVPDTEFYNSLRTFDSSWYVSHDSTAFEDFSVSELQSFGPDAAAGTVRFTYMVYKEGLRPRSYASVYRMYAVRDGGGWKLLDLQVQ